MNDGRRNGRKGHIRVEEPLVLATGEATEIVANSFVLIAWTRKLLGSHVSVSYSIARGRATLNPVEHELT